MTDADTITIHAFIERHHLGFSVEPASGNPHAAGEWPAGASHWLCKINSPRSGTRPMLVPFSMGSAHRHWNERKLKNDRGTFTPAEKAKLSPILGGRGLGGAPESVALRELREECSEPTPPTLADVLDCLASDCASYDNARSFEDWAADFGYDSDSRKAENTYRVCGDQAKELRHILGDEAYAELLHNVERL